MTWENFTANHGYFTDFVIHLEAFKLLEKTIAVLQRHL